MSIGKCCYCNDDCNSASQACGRCLRLGSRYISIEEDDEYSGKGWMMLNDIRSSMIKIDYEMIVVQKRESEIIVYYRSREPIGFKYTSVGLFNDDFDKIRKAMREIN